MTTVAKGTKKPSHSSNMSLATIEFLLKGHFLGGKRDCGVPVTMETKFVAMATKKKDSRGSIRNFKAKAMRIRVPV